jgi:hypothetical protein
MSDLDRYMKDPDIVDEPMPLREVHAIRLMIRDETKDMNADERRAYYRKQVEDAGRLFGLKISSPHTTGRGKAI